LLLTKPGRVGELSTGRDARCGLEHATNGKAGVHADFAVLKYPREQQQQLLLHIKY